MATSVLPRQPGHRTTHARGLALRYLGLVPFLMISLFPLVWMAITAIKQEPDLYRTDLNPFWFHLPPTLKNFEFLFNQTHYVDWIVNTLSISAWVSLLTLAAAVPAGYALTRLRLRFAENLGISIFLTYLVSPIILFIPLARIVGLLDLQDRWWALVVIYPTFTIPFCTWLLMGFFKTVPVEIEEAAMVDGCGQLGALWRVVLPVSWPGLITAVIFSFTLSMQDFLYALAYVSISNQKPIPLGVATELIRGDVYFWGSLMAGALLVGIPVAILYNIFLDRFIAGITGAAIK
jgi:multiple sugar transport system permease protein